MHRQIGFTTGAVAHDGSEWTDWLRRSATDLAQIADFVELYSTGELSSELRSQPLPVRSLHPYRGGRLMTSMALRALCQRALELSAWLPLTFILHPNPEYADDPTSQVRDIWMRACGLLNADINQDRLVIGIEMTGDVTDDHAFASAFRRCRDDSAYAQRIGLVADTEHQYFKGTALTEWLDANRDLLVAVHIKDCDDRPYDQNGERRFVSYGQGNIDFSALFPYIANYIPLTLEGSYQRVEGLSADLIALRHDAGEGLKT